MTSQGPLAHPPAGSDAGSNRYSVRLPRDHGWSVEILDPDGGVVFRRACANEAEARTFASTVQQHVYWLSEAKFRSYYKLPGPAEG